MSAAQFQWARIDEFTSRALHSILQARESVFVVEQNCPYQDADEHDLTAWHLVLWAPQTFMQPSHQVAAYARVVTPGGKYNEPSIGRVLTTAPFRRQGLGQELMTRIIAHTRKVYPQENIRISAQARLERFYQGFGFQTVSAPYLEDNIEHVEMLLTHDIKSR